MENDIDLSLNLGYARKGIGTHSNRKFLESTADSKMDGPSRIQVEQFKGWAEKGIATCLRRIMVRAWLVEL